MGIKKEKKRNQCNRSVIVSFLINIGRVCKKKRKKKELEREKRKKAGVEFFFSWSPKGKNIAYYVLNGVTSSLELRYPIGLGRRVYSFVSCCSEPTSSKERILYDSSFPLRRDKKKWSFCYLGLYRETKESDIVSNSVQTYKKYVSCSACRLLNFSSFSFSAFLKFHT